MERSIEVDMTISRDTRAHVPSVFENSRATKDVVLDAPEKRFGLFSFLLEIIRCIEILDVLLESRTIGPGLKRAVITWLNSLDLEEIILGLFTVPRLCNLPGTYW